MPGHFSSPLCQLLLWPEGVIYRAYAVSPKHPRYVKVNSSTHVLDISPEFKTSRLAPAGFGVQQS